MLATAEGRARLWAESAAEPDRCSGRRFPSGLAGDTRVIEQTPPTRFVVEYLGGSVVTFTLANDGTGSTNLTLRDDGVVEEDCAEVNAGWISVLLALKAA